MIGINKINNRIAAQSWHPDLIGINKYNNRIDAQSGRLLLSVILKIKIIIIFTYNSNNLNMLCVSFSENEKIKVTNQTLILKPTLMSESFQISASFTVKPSSIYNAWLDSKEHSEMTGSDAICSAKEGDNFSAWDGYITGKNVKLIPDKEIVQKWRTFEFDDSDPDSDLIIRFKEIKSGCELMLIHNNIPPGQPDYKQGWIDNYFIPMKDYFKSKT